MDRSPKELVRDLVAARNAGSIEHAVDLLAVDARYWDCLRGTVEGCDAVAGALLGVSRRRKGARLDLEMLAGDESHAVAEIRVAGSRPSGRYEFRTTEVYAVHGDRVAWCRVYFDPEDVPAAA